MDTLSQACRYLRLVIIAAAASASVVHAATIDSAETDTAVRYTAGKTADIRFYSRTVQDKTTTAYGAKADLRPLTGIPVAVYGGMISCAGLISRLKTPVTQTGSATAAAPRPGAMTLSLPASAAEHPAGAGIRFTADTFTAAAVWQKDGTWKASAGTGVQYQSQTSPRRLRLSLNMAAGTFRLQPPSFSTWYSTTRRFMPRRYHAFAIESAVRYTGRSTSIQSIITAGLHENPFSTVRYWLKNESSIQLRIPRKPRSQQVLRTLSLNTVLFATDRFLQHPHAEEIISTDGTRMHIQAYCSLNPQITLAPSARTVLKAGVSAAQAYKTETTPSGWYERRLEAAASLAGRPGTLRMSAGMRNSKSSAKSSSVNQYTGRISASHTGAAAAVSLSYQPDSGTAVQKVSISFSGAGGSGIAYAAGAAVSCTEKQRKFSSGSVQAALKLKKTFGGLSCSAKFIVISSF